MVRFILGQAASGKTTYAYKEIIRQAKENPDKNYFYVVPSQFTLQTQKNLVENHPDHVLMNIDVVSLELLFSRVRKLAGKDIKMLGESGKRMLVKRVMLKMSENLSLYKSYVKSDTFIDKVKSAISEFYQYDITPAKLREYSENIKEGELFKKKLADIVTLYEEFDSHFKDGLLPREGLYDCLAENLGSYEPINNSVVYFDNFTGFTPSQYRLIRQIIAVAEDVYFVATYEGRSEKKHRSFFEMSENYINIVKKLTSEAGKLFEEPVFIDGKNFASDDIEYLKQNIFKVGRIVRTNSSGNIRIFSAIDEKNECKMVATQILKDLVEEDLRYKDIAIICGDIGVYGETMARALKNIGVPSFYDAGRTLIESELGVFITCLFEMAVNNYRKESVIGYVKTLLSGWNSEDACDFENYLISASIKYVSKETPFKKKAQTVKFVDLSNVEKHRIKLMSETRDIVAYLSDKKKNTTLKINALRRFFDKISLEKRIEEIADKAENMKDERRKHELIASFTVLDEVLSECDELLGNEIMNIKELFGIISTGMSGVSVLSVPTSDDYVIIGDIERTRIEGVKKLYVLGMNDGFLPKNASGTGLLSDNDKEKLEENGVYLAPNGIRSIEIEKFYLYQLLGKALNQITFSFAKVSDGEARTVSPYLLKIKDLFNNIVVEEKIKDEVFDILRDDKGKSWFIKKLSDYLKSLGKKDSEEWDDEEILMALATSLDSEELYEYINNATGRYYERGNGSIAAKCLYGQVINSTISRLESFVKCPFEFFLKYGLGLEPRVSDNVQSNEYGTILHAVMEQYFKMVKEEMPGIKPGEVAREKRIEMVEKVVEKLVAENGKFDKENASDASKIQEIKTVSLSYIDIATYQLSKSDFVPEGFEHRFNYEDDKIKLHGTIDRFDIMEKWGRIFVKLVDYKSSSKTKSFSLKKLYEGLDFQLPLYFASIRKELSEKYPEMPVEFAGAFYAPMEYLTTKDMDISKLASGTISDVKNNVEAAQKSDIVDSLFKDMLEYEDTDSTGDIDSMSVFDESFETDIFKDLKLGGMFALERNVVGGLDNDLYDLAGRKAYKETKREELTKSGVDASEVEEKLDEEERKQYDNGEELISAYPFVSNGVKSKNVNITLTKRSNEGDALAARLDKKTSEIAFTKRELEIILSYSIHKAQLVAKQILSGEFSKTRCDSMHCTYCDYKETCGFSTEKRDCKDLQKRKINGKKEEIIDLMEAELNEKM
ncbi:MAG: PD-(D/E)XK nuclease family protein [Lachnospiraceae bacterium]|nr:PD-(D/E)XK nuclease family protein [Lachnospiraceae bacterium]